MEWFSLKPYCPSWSNLLQVNIEIIEGKLPFRIASKWMVKEISDNICLLLKRRLFKQWNNFGFCQPVPAIRDWVITIVRGFSRAGDIDFSNFVDMPSCPEEFFVRKYAKVLAMWFSPTREKLKEVKIFIIRYLWWVSWETLDTLLMRLCPMLIKIVKFIDDFCCVVYLSFCRWIL